MTPQEKAYELVSRFNFEHLGDRYVLHQTVEESKRCALIAVNELIKQEQKIAKRIHKISFLGNPFIEVVNLGKFWNEVKQEIEKL